TSLSALPVTLAQCLHFAVLTNRDDLVDSFYWAQFQEAAKLLDVKVAQFEARVPGDIDPAFAQMRKHGSGAVVVMTEVFLAGQMHRIVPLVDRYKLPAIYGFNVFDESGG